MANRAGLKVLFGVGVLSCLLWVSGCMLSFDHYVEGDPCAAALDAGIELESASDQVLRGCDAGPPAKNDEDASEAGAAGTASH